MAHHEAKLQGWNLEAGIVKIIKARGDSKPTSPWKVSKHSWIKLVSNSSAKMEIFGGIGKSWKLSSVYENITGGDRTVPKPQLTKVSVTSKGTMGSMRETNVSFTLYSKDQLITAQKAFFIPGMSVVCTWGWNIKTDGTTVTQFEMGGKSVAAVFELLGGWSEANDYSTDGTFGQISDFDWSYKADSLSYDCSIVITSPSRAYLTTGMKLVNKTICGCYGEEDDKIIVPSGTWAKKALIDIAEKKTRFDEEWVSNKIYMGTMIRQDQDAEEKIVSGFKGFFQRLFMMKSRMSYVTWGWMESILLTSGLSPECSEINNVIGETKYPSLQKAHKDNFLHKVWRLDSGNTELKIPSPHVYSSDPRICLIPGYYHWDVAGGKDSNVSKLKGLPKGKKKAFGLVEMLLSTSFLFKVALEEDSMDGFIMKVANTVALTCGGIWQFALTSDPDDPSVMSVINKKTVNAIHGTIPSFSLTGLTSPARSWGMSSDIPSDLKHSIMMGTNKKANSTNVSDDDEYTWALYGTSVQDNFYKSLALYTECIPTIEDAKNCKALGQDSVHEDDGAALIAQRKKAADELMGRVDDETVATAVGAIRKDIASEEKKFNEMSPRVMPIGIDLILDGIAGLNWGRRFKINDVKGVIDYDYFQITGVSQEINKNDWTTTVKTALRP